MRREPLDSLNQFVEIEKKAHPHNQQAVEKLVGEMRELMAGKVTLGVALRATAEVFLQLFEQYLERGEDLS